MSVSWKVTVGLVAWLVVAAVGASESAWSQSAPPRESTPKKSAPKSKVDPAGRVLLDVRFRERFETLARGNDRAALARHLDARPEQLIPLIEAYLNEALELFGSTRDGDRIASLQGFAMRAALVADTLYRTVLYSDYVTAFLAWSSKERSKYRGTRRSLDLAARYLTEGKIEPALRAAQSAVEDGQTLGAWPQVAEGLTRVGEALESLEQPGAAVSNFSTASVLATSLQLLSLASTSQTGMARILGDSGRLPRALNSVEQAIGSGGAWAEITGDYDPLIAALDLYSTLQEKAGDVESAAATRRRLRDVMARSSKKPKPRSGQGD